MSPKPGIFISAVSSELKKEDPEAARKRAMQELAKQYGLDPKELE